MTPFAGPQRAGVSHQEASMCRRSADQKSAWSISADQDAPGQQIRTDRAQLSITRGDRSLVLLSPDAWLLILLSIITGVLGFVADLLASTHRSSPCPQLVGFVLVLLTALLLMLMYGKAAGASRSRSCQRTQQPIAISTAKSCRNRPQRNTVLRLDGQRRAGIQGHSLQRQQRGGVLQPIMVFMWLRAA